MKELSLFFILLLFISCTVTKENGKLPELILYNQLSKQVQNSSLSDVNTLSDLIISSGVLNPIFSPSINNYTVALPNLNSKFILKPKTTSSLSTVTVNGLTTISGNSLSIDLRLGKNSIPIIVTAQNGKANTYILDIILTGLRIFITASQYNGNLGYPSGGDVKCNSDSNKPSGGSIYKALLVDASYRVACTSGDCTNIAQNIDWVLRPNTTYGRASDAKVIFNTNSAGIFVFTSGGTLTNSFDSGSQKNYWTGMNGQWQNPTTGCYFWGSNSVIYDGASGYSDRIDVESIFSSVPTLGACQYSKYLLCVEQ